MQNRTICLLNDSFPPVIDGVSNCVVNYAENILSLGGNALVATPAVEGADDSAFGFPVLRYPSIDTRRQFGYVTGYPFSPEISEKIKESRPDVLHTHCPVTSCLFARSLRYLTDAPVILTYHTKFDIDISNAIRGRLVREGALRALLLNIRACDEVWAVSEGAGENLRKLGYEGDYVVMRNGVDMPPGPADEKDVSLATDGFDLPAGVPVFLFVGRMMWYKNVRIILDALARLSGEGRDFRMVFIGGGGDAAEIAGYSSRCGLDGKCIFIGPVRDRRLLRAWYTRADLFLFPSTFDTNGLVVREAAAAGTASVLVAGSSAAEGVISGRNGFLIEEDAEYLAGCLSGLYGDMAFVKQAGENASRDLYVSWHTAVSAAWERYGTVSENYRSGLYGKKSGDAFFRSQSELMDLMSVLEERRRAMMADIAAARSAVRDRRNVLRNGIEYAREALSERRDRHL